MSTTLDTAPAPGAPAGAASAAGIVDCDIHPITRSARDLHPYLSARWRRHLETYGSFQRSPFFANNPYPRDVPALSRRDAWPPGGGGPGSDLDFMREQHLDPNRVLVGLLQVLAPSGIAQRNVDFGVATCRAVNEWQLEHWTTPEPRLRACLTVPQEDPAQAVAEIEHWAGDTAFAQIAMAPRAFNPLGQRHYWPVYEAATAHGLPIGLHGSGYSGHPDTGSGSPSYYAEDHHSNAMSMQAFVTSLVFEGVFERFPTLKIVLVEGGFAWALALAWRLDRLWERFGDEVPHVPRPPSAYLRRNLWITSQPMEEPARPRHLRDVIEWMGEDRVLFSTDYPHWDYDDPAQVFKVGFSDDQRHKLFRANACAVYGFELPESTPATVAGPGRTEAVARHVVAPVAEIPPGERKVVDVGGREIVVLNIDGEFFALLDRCPHQAASFAGGVLCSLVESDGPGSYRLSRQGEILRCPWHGWEFDVRTGQSWCEPTKVKVRRYDATVEAGSRLVEGPYVADTFPVSVEGAYVVVEV